MPRPVTVKVPPRRSQCRTCKGPVWRLYLGSGRSIDFARDGNRTLRDGDAKHECTGKEPA